MSDTTLSPLHVVAHLILCTAVRDTFGSRKMCLPPECTCIFSLMCFQNSYFSVTESYEGIKVVLVLVDSVASRVPSLLAKSCLRSIYSKERQDELKQFLY